MSNSTETDLVRRIMLTLSKFPGVRVFRNNTGAAWIGKSFVAPRAMQVNVNKGDVIVYQGRYFVAGLCVGSSDIIGFKSVTVTPEMVGKTVAIFIANEVKTPTGKISPEQQIFLDVVNNHGGIGFVARSEDDAKKMMDGWNI